MYDFCLKDDGKMSEFFQQYQDFLDRWLATKPATARRSRGCSSGTSASKKFRYCLKNEGCILKEVQPSFRALNAKLCHFYVAKGFPRHIVFLIMSHQMTLMFCNKTGAASENGTALTS